MNSMPDFDELKKHVDCMKKLLDDPQPGIFSWCGFLGEHWKKVADMWKEPIKEKE